MMVVFPIHYFPSVAWFTAALHHQQQGHTLVLEQWEHYRKQHFFNRAFIRNPDRILKLSMPICKAKEHTPVARREISLDGTWARDHFRALDASYRASPYFEFYEDQLTHFFEQPQTSLLAHNLEILRTVVQCLQLDLNWELTTSYQDADQYEADYRRSFDPKNEDLPAWFEPVPYRQVFGDAFDPNMSILDLMFNMGPESVRILQEGWKGDE